MQRADFTYQLPDDLIAQAPADRRGQSRLLHLDGQGAIHHREFGDLKVLLRPGDLLVVNDTRVIPARAFGRKASGGRVEFLLERILDEHALLAHLRASRAPAVGGRILLDAKESLALEVVGRQGDLFELRADCPVLPWLNQYGHVPLPPYIRRADDASDRQRYQTVFAHSPGAVAAPTAGLHFDEQHLRQLQEAGVGLARITLHVGSGTFLPVRVDDLSRHRMHAEWCEVPEAVCRAIDNTRQAGNRVVAVGTTVARALESAAADGSLEPFCGLTRLFIRPGYRFAAIDALITNFHLPESTLLMLVCAFAGKERVLAAYAEAVARRYRFFSYGDAMFVEGDSGALMSPKTGVDVG